MTDLTIIEAYSTYTLNICLTYSMPASDSPSTDPIPVNVYLRQKQYPYKQLTDVQALTGVASVTGGDGCQSVTLLTADTTLLMNIENYASIVFDMAPAN